MPDAGFLGPRRWAVYAACTIFCLGFGALNVFSAAGLGQPHLPGLYTFRSATIGDGLMLPLLAYSLVRFAGPHRRRGGKRAAFASAGVVLGVLTGTAVQMYALAEPDPPLDWTFPAPHSYNFPGWYHTVFLIAASGFYCGMLFLVLTDLRESTRRNPDVTLRRIRSIGTLGVLAPGAAFIGLLEEDDLAGAAGTSHTVLETIAVMALLFTVALCWACGWRHLRWCVLTVLGSLLPVVALCDLFLPGHAITFSSALFVSVASLAAGVIFFFRASRASLGRVAAHLPRIFITACQAVCVVGPIYARLTRRSSTAQEIAIACLISVLLASSELGIIQSLLRSRPAWAERHPPQAI